MLFLFLAPKPPQSYWIMQSQYLPAADTVYVFQPDKLDPHKAYPLIYLLHGYGQTSRQWNRITDLKQLANRFQAIIICPDGFQTWYLNSPLLPDSRFEDFFFNDLAPKVHRQYLIDKRNIFISGLSMGGYGALHLFLLKPSYFNTAAATSGAYDFERTAWEKASLLFFNNDRINHDLSRLLGDDDTNWEDYSLPRQLQQAQVHKPFLFDCGSEDILLPMTLKLKQVCDSLKIPVTCTFQPGDHDEDYWRKSIVQHIDYFKAHMR